MKRFFYYLVCIVSAQSTTLLMSMEAPPMTPVTPRSPEHLRSTFNQKWCAHEGFSSEQDLKKAMIDHAAKKLALNQPSGQNSIQKCEHNVEKEKCILCSSPELQSVAPCAICSAELDSIGSSQNSPTSPGSPRLNNSPDYDSSPHSSDTEKQ
jgi:hypothetical protein